MFRCLRDQLHPMSTVWAGLAPNHTNAVLVQSMRVTRSHIIKETGDCYISMTIVSPNHVTHIDQKSHEQMLCAISGCVYHAFYRTLTLILGTHTGGACCLAYLRRYCCIPFVMLRRFDPKDNRNWRDSGSLCGKLDKQVSSMFYVDALRDGQRLAHCLDG